jgi:hypothetical protein
VNPILQNALMRQARIDPLEVDPVTGEPVPTVAVEVEVLPTQQVVYGHVLSQGTHTIRVPETVVPLIQCMVEDASDQDMALVERELTWHRAELERGDNPQQWEPSLPASFRKVMHRDMRPLRSCRLLDAQPVAQAKRRRG